MTPHPCYGMLEQYAATQNSDLQNNSSASLRQALVMASGARCQKLLRLIVSENIAAKTLLYVNATHAASDETQAENLDFHFRLLCSCLASMAELDDYAKSYPWKAVLCLKDSMWPDVLDDLRREWQMVRLIDRSKPKNLLFKLFSWTRWQATRELYIAAECLGCYCYAARVIFVVALQLRSIGFDENHSQATAVRKTALSVAGVTEQNEEPILQSLACELMFNDARDCQKRHRKADWTRPVNVCGACVTSGWTRSPFESVKLHSQDWQEDASLSALRSHVLSAQRQTDKELGVCLQSLISDRSCSHLTKPHIFCDRLRLFRALRASFEAAACAEEELEKRVDDAWPVSLLGQEPCMWHTAQDEWRLILKTSSYCARCMHVTQAPRDDERKIFLLVPNTTVVFDSLDVRMDGQEFSPVHPVVLEDTVLQHSCWCI